MIFYRKSEIPEHLLGFFRPAEMGLEPTPDEFVAALVNVFREVKRVLRDDGTLWLNLGDSYAGSGPSGASYQSKTTKSREGKTSDGSFRISKTLSERGLTYADKKPIPPIGLKQKDLIGIPWRVAFALQADGWYLRQDIIWSKPNPMPESVKDRCTKAHEYIFLLSKSQRYYFDSESIRNPPSEALIKQVNEGYSGKDTKEFSESGAQSASGTKARIIEQARLKVEKARGHTRTHTGFRDKWDSMTREEQQMLGSNRRSVWTVATKPYKGAHFATFPPDLIRPCVQAGCPAGGTVLDPFGGSGTTAQVAIEEGRSAILCELNPEYVKLAHQRVRPVWEKHILLEEI